MTPLVYWDDGLQCLLHVCVCARRQRFIPLISTPSELRGRRFTRRKSAWLLSWSFSGSRTSTSRMRWSQWAGTIYLTFAACVFLRSICLRLLCIKQNRWVLFVFCTGSLWVRCRRDTCLVVQTQVIPHHTTTCRGSEVSCYSTVYICFFLMRCSWCQWQHSSFNYSVTEEKADLIVGKWCILISGCFKV